MEEILHQLLASLSHYLHFFYIPGGTGFLPSTVFTYLYTLHIYIYICMNIDVEGKHASLDLRGPVQCPEIFPYTTIPNTLG